MALSPEQIASAQTPQQMAVSGANGTPTKQAITPSSLTPDTPIQPAIQSPYVPPTVEALPKLQITAQEQGALDQVDPLQKYVDYLSGSTSELAQKSYRNQQSESLGLNAANNLAQNLYDKQQALDLKSNSIEALRQQAIQEKQQAMSGQGIASSIVNRHSAIDTEYNRQSLTNTLAKLDNAVSYYAASGRVREAQQAVDQAVDAEFTPKLIALDTAQRNLASLLKSPNLTSAMETRALNKQAELTAQQDAIKAQAQQKKDTGDARIKVLTNNPNMTQLQHDAIAAAQSPEEIAQLVNYFGLSSISKSDQLDQTLKQTQIDKAQYDLAHPNKHTQVIEAAGGHTQLINTDTGDIIKDYGVKSAPSGASAPVQNYNGEFEATIKLAAQQGGTNEQRGQIEQNLKQFIAAGDYKSAYAQIANATLQGLKGSTATTFANQQNSLGVLSALKTAIQQYADAGGNTNIFKGGVDDIQTKIGQLYTDPKYAALATQLDSAFQQYRLNMTGAAFGAKESAEYASVLPSKGNSLDLNLAKLKGAEDYLNSSVNTSIKNVVGEGGVNIKDRAMMGDGEMQQTQISDAGLNDDQAYQLYLQMISGK